MLSKFKLSKFTVHEGGPITAIIHVDPTETFTTVSLIGARYAGLGTAKRNPRDRHDMQVGIDVAMTRALRDLADHTAHGAGDQ